MQKAINATMVIANVIMMAIFPYHPAVMFAIGYTVRHFIQHGLNRVLKSRPTKNVILDPSQIKDSIMSFNGGKSWYIRTRAGGKWIGVHSDIIQKILNHYATKTEQKSSDQHVDAPSAEA